jgi:plastocyanin
MNPVTRNMFRSIAATILVLSASLCLAGPREEPPQAREIKVIARKFEFQPKTITVHQGERIRLVITAVDVDHGIAIKAFGVDQQIKAKQTKAVEFSADREGKFEFTCSVFCGEGHPDMVGVLIVTGEQAPASSNLKVSFDDNAPGVAFVEVNGERVRIDTQAKTYVRVEATEPATRPRATKDQPAVVATKERESSKAYEPYDYHIVNIPTPKRVPRHSLNLYFTHRFEEPIKPLDESANNLFGLDSTAVPAFGFTYGITDKLYASIYRSPLCQTGLCRTIEMGFGYHWLDQAGRSPVALSTYASVEGDDNFRHQFTYNIQAMIGRSITRYVNVFFSPAAHINANGSGRFNPRPGFLPPEILKDFRLGKHSGSFGFGINARIRPTTSLLFEYTPRGGFKLGRTRVVTDEDTGQLIRLENDSEAEIGFGIEKRIGRHVFSLTFSNTQTTTTSRYNSSNQVLPPSKFAIGFNIFRRLL